MTSPLNAIPFPSRLEQLEIREAKADKHLEDSEKSFLLFLEVALEIKESKDWKERATSWAAYCRLRWHKSDAYIRQLKSLIPLAESLFEELGVSPNPSQLKALNEVCKPHESIDKGYVYKVAAQNTGGKPPTRGDFKAVVETIIESRSGLVEVDGLVYNSSPDAIDAKVLELMRDKVQRQRDYMATGNKQKYTLRADGIFKDDCRVGELSELADYLGDDSVNIYLARKDEN